MKFCDKCGSSMEETKSGFSCRKCGDVVRIQARTRSGKKVERSSSIFVVENSEDERLTVSQACPKCGAGEAFRWFSRVSGEHAGVRRERTLEHFKCTRCSQSWTKIS